ncbi:hypothetical protein ACNRWW_11955 [Metabacillus sp. HB246100]
MNLMDQWGKQFPFDQFGFTKKVNKMQPQEVESYIQHVMSSVFGDDFSKGFPFQGHILNPSNEDHQKVNPTIFETEDYVYVRIPKFETVEELKLHHTNYKLIIENFPKKHEKSEYMLPSPVKKKGAKASSGRDYIEIQFLKLKQYSTSEIQINERTNE